MDWILFWSVLSGQDDRRLQAQPIILHFHVEWGGVNRIRVDLQYQNLQLQRPGVVISHEQSHIRADLCDLSNILHHGPKG